MIDNKKERSKFYNLYPSKRAFGKGYQEQASVLTEDMGSFSLKEKKETQYFITLGP